MENKLEILAAKTDALRAKYLAAALKEQAALAARLNQITGDAHAAEVVTRPEAFARISGMQQAQTTFTAKPLKRRGRPLGAKNKATANVDDIAKGRALQGKYIGYIRQFPPAERVEWSAMAKQIGRKKTIAAMKQALEVRKAVAAQQQG